LFGEKDGTGEADGETEETVDWACSPGDAEMSSLAPKRRGVLMEFRETHSEDELETTIRGDARPGVRLPCVEDEFGVDGKLEMPVGVLSCHG
jgi:hypothetical protein